MTVQLIKQVCINGTLVCRTGMRIGGTKEDIEIGGLDNPVLRDPLTLLPYIPGSSLKGKLRTLLEWSEKKAAPNGNPHGCTDPKCLICRVFGPHFTSNPQSGPTRLIMRDLFLSDKSKQILEEKLGDKLFTEVKQEVSIDRNTGKASGAGPRTMERVPAGTEFDLNISLRIFDVDTPDEIITFVGKGLKLIENDYLGGSGTRGYGWVKIENLTVSDC
jgi:CRISPR-associated protein Csm3